MKYEKTSDQILETVRYESKKELLDLPDVPATLDNFFEEEVQEAETNHWEKHWVGMPEFENDENKPYHELKVKFPTEEDMKAFAELVGQRVDKKVKNIEFPQVTKRQKPADFAWVYENEG